MSKFEAKTVCILGRQPALGLAELESLYGAGRVRPLGGHALLDVPAGDINFSNLGGTIKVAKVLAGRPSAQWKDLAAYLIKEVPAYAKALPDGKFTLGLSVYGIEAPLRQIEAALLEIKKLVRQTDRPVRVVPNKTAALSSAQVLHNKLTHKGAWELMLIKSGSGALLTQTMFVQDIGAYAARDQARPARDPRVGMLPPKLAQIIINLAAGQPKSGELDRYLVLDPFCGSGVILQEALLMGYSAYGTDVDDKMVGFSRRNLRWLFQKYPDISGRVIVDQADATNYRWLGSSCVASETYLGRPLVKLPPEADLKKIISDTNLIIKRFLQNLAPQLKPGQPICLAVPAWRKPDGRLVRLPMLAKLTDMGYTYRDLKHVRRDDLIYYREGQIVARQLLKLKKV